MELDAAADLAFCGLRSPLRGRWLAARLLTKRGQTAAAAELAELLRDDAQAAGEHSVAAGVASLLVELYIDLGRLGDALEVGPFEPRRPRLRGGR